MVDSYLKNLYEKYWIEKPVLRHSYQIGDYHVSQVGADHSNLAPEDHSGPCLREAFYKYVDAIPDTMQTTGNFHQGRLMHTEVQRIYLINNNGAIAEYPVGRLVQFKDEQFKALGSIDIYHSEFSNKPFINILDVIDGKSASDYTFPDDPEDKNPTHFDQVKIYAFMLITYCLNKRYNKIRNLKVVYFAKHNLYTGEQVERFDLRECQSKYMSFINRCYILHKALQEMKLPKAEPHKWCSYCSYAGRCNADVIHDKDIPTVTLEEVKKLYSEKTGKSPIWRDKETQGFQKFKFKFKIEGEES